MTDRTKYPCEITRSEFAGNVLGVPGRFHNLVRHSATSPNQRIRNQEFGSSWREYTEDGQWYRARVRIRHDDELLNGHPDFSITGETQWAEREKWYHANGGCIHDTIERVFPELKDLIKWHLCSTEGPMHYVANTTYFAGDRDCRGLREGEKRQLVNGRTKEPVWRRVMYEDGLEVTKGPNDRRDGERPTSVLTAGWEPVWIVGEGKKRDLDVARSAAIWPEATDEELSVSKEELTAALEARLPDLLRRFREMIESIGFEFE